jgi:hypothetical protein
MKRPSRVLVEAMASPHDETSLVGLGNARNSPSSSTAENSYFCIAYSTGELEVV